MDFLKKTDDIFKGIGILASVGVAFSLFCVIHCQMPTILGFFVGGLAVISTILYIFLIKTMNFSEISKNESLFFGLFSLLITIIVYSISLFNIPIEFTAVSILYLSLFSIISGIIGKDSYFGIISVIGSIFAIYKFVYDSSVLNSLF